jgi:tripeptidyl-peptidase-1
LTPNIPAGTGPVIDLIDGAVVQTTSSGFNYNGESDLDLEYAIALGKSDPPTRLPDFTANNNLQVYPQKVTLYQVGDIVEGGSFNTFLDALYLTYCTSGGGDTPGM